MIIAINIFMTAFVTWISCMLYKLIKKNNINIIDYQFNQIENSKGLKKSVHRLVIPMLIIGGTMIFILLAAMWICF